MIHLFCLLLCLARWWELRQCIWAGICSRELVAFGMYVNGEDEWHPLLSCNYARNLNFNALDRYMCDVWLVAWEINIIFGHFFGWGIWKVVNNFLLKSFIFFPTLYYYLCFVLYYFVTSYIINIKNFDKKKHQITDHSSFIRDFCWFIVWGWCYLEFLKGTLGES